MQARAKSGSEAQGTGSRAGSDGSADLVGQARHTRHPNSMRRRDVGGCCRMEMMSEEQGFVKTPD